MAELDTPKAKELKHIPYETINKYIAENQFNLNYKGNYSKNNPWSKVYFKHLNLYSFAQNYKECQIKFAEISELICKHLPEDFKCTGTETIKSIDIELVIFLLAQYEELSTNTSKNISQLNQIKNYIAEALKDTADQVNELIKDYISDKKKLLLKLLEKYNYPKEYSETPDKLQLALTRCLLLTLGHKTHTLTDGTAVLDIDLAIANIAIAADILKNIKPPEDELITKVTNAVDFVEELRIFLWENENVTKYFETDDAGSLTEETKIAFNEACKEFILVWREQLDIAISENSLKLLASGILHHDYKNITFAKNLFKNRNAIDSALKKFFSEPEYTISDLEETMNALKNEATEWKKLTETDITVSKICIFLSSGNYSLLLDKVNAIKNFPDNEELLQLLKYAMTAYASCVKQAKLLSAITTAEETKDDSEFDLYIRHNNDSIENQGDASTYSSLDLARRLIANTTNHSVVIGFDSEWYNIEEDNANSRNILSWQFSFFSKDEKFIYELIVLPKTENRLNYQSILAFILRFLNYEERGKDIIGYRKEAASKSKIKPLLYLEKSQDHNCPIHKKIHDRVNVTLIGHCGIVDITAFAKNDENQLVLLDQLTQVGKGIFTHKPLQLDLNYNNSFLFLNLNIRDTVNHTTDDFSSLKDLGNAINHKKLELVNEDLKVNTSKKFNNKEFMDILLINNFLKFFEYAVTDSTITLLYAAFIYGIGINPPPTITSAATKLFKAYIGKTLADFAHNIDPKNKFYLNDSDYKRLVKAFKIDEQTIQSENEEEETEEASGSDSISSSSSEFFNRYRGLIKVNTAAVEDLDGLKLIPTSSMEPISFDYQIVNYMAAKAYHGGYNASLEIGWYDNPTIDYDLKNCYPTALSVIPAIDPAKPIDFIEENFILDSSVKGDEIIIDDKGNRFAGPKYLEKHCLNIPFYDGSQQTTASLPFLLFCLTEFTFNDNVDPCISINVDGVPIYPKTYKEPRGIFVSGCELKLALDLGVTIKVEKMVKLNALKDKNNQICRPYAPIIRKLVQDRTKAKVEKAKFSDKLLKIFVNSAYGKIAQGLSHWGVVHTHTDKPLREITQITNPISACFTTSIITSSLLAVQNEVLRKNYYFYSVTTDGFISNIDEAELLKRQMYGYRKLLICGRASMYDPKDEDFIHKIEIWEPKHKQKSLLNISTRTNVGFGLVAKSNESPEYYEVVCAHGGYISPYVKDSNEDRADLAFQVLTRQGRVSCSFSKWSSLAALKKNQSDYNIETTPKSVSFDFDLKRKPLRTSIQDITVPAIKILDSAHNTDYYIIANFKTEPYDDIQQYRLYKDTKTKLLKSGLCLRTRADWHRFFDIIDAQGSGKKLLEDKPSYWFYLRAVIRRLFFALSTKGKRFNFDDIFECNISDINSASIQQAFKNYCIANYNPDITTRLLFVNFINNQIKDDPTVYSNQRINTNYYSENDLEEDIKQKSSISKFTVQDLHPIILKLANFPKPAITDEKFCLDAIIQYLFASTKKNKHGVKIKNLLSPIESFQDTIKPELLPVITAYQNYHNALESKDFDSTFLAFIKEIDDSYTSDYLERLKFKNNLLTIDNVSIDILKDTIDKLAKVKH